MNDQLVNYKKLLSIGIALSSETRIEALLELILGTAKDITNADGGTLYRLSENGQNLRFEILHNTSLQTSLGGTTGKPINFKPLAMFDDQGQPNNSMIAVCAAHSGQTFNIKDAYLEDGFDFSGTRAFDTSTGYRSKSFLTVPMFNHQHECIGVLQLINAIDSQTKEIIEFSQESQYFAEALASQAAVALTNRILINQLEELLESFIQVINNAIDEKSPYTGGHCLRVPAITLMLADAVAKSTDGPFADFSLNKDQRYELQMASMLHDCGKVTTPVHVVDKATKLETIFDRIQLIDTRSQIIKRDFHIAALEAQLARLQWGNHQLDEDLQATYDEQVAQLASDIDFLRLSNIGGEAMSDADCARVSEMEERYTWDSGRGTEPFLIPNERDNLLIRRGTLNNEERDIINYHIKATIRMLETLPWPKHLRNVAEYAGGHHERMDGKGYPKGLTRHEMSIPARIMGIADVFEALTAKDRPYKKGMPLSQALSILKRMAAEGHIDPDLFQIFIQEKVYLKYAEEFLDEFQIDLSVDDVV